MFDIDFYRRWKPGIDPESIRSRTPIVYNIETTNACNMRCKMCPRTTMMTRPIETMSLDLFEKIADQLTPFSWKQWDQWTDFCILKYRVFPWDMSENHFFLYIIPKVIQLHGYGDPLLDKNIAKMVGALTKRGFKSYFSCNPANIDIDRTLEIFGAGLGYIKYSIESTSDAEHKEIRGKASNFSESYENILKLLRLRKKHGLGTEIVITMLDLNRKNQREEWNKLRDLFYGEDVYIYLKSEDTQWYRGDYHGTNSIHWSEPCKHPWMSMTIKSNGEAAMCMEDFNNEIVLGDTKTQSLEEIWNGTLYEQFRQQHMEATKGIRCTERCDMKVMGA